MNAEDYNVLKEIWNREAEQERLQIFRAARPRQELLSDKLIEETGDSFPDLVAKIQELQFQCITDIALTYAEDQDAQRAGCQSITFKVASSSLEGFTISTTEEGGLAITTYYTHEQKAEQRLITD